jgi:hypothetical protein
MIPAVTVANTNFELVLEPSPGALQQLSVVTHFILLIKLRQFLRTEC